MVSKVIGFDKSVFLRQESLLGSAFQKKIGSLKIGVLGLGGLGSNICQLLTRLGVRDFVLMDFDKIEKHNLSRQELFGFHDVGLFKADVIARELKRINPDLDVFVSKKKVSSLKDLDPFLDCDIVFDGLDNHKTRRLLDLFCKQEQKNWIHGSAVRAECVAYFFDESTRYEDIYSLDAKDFDCNLEGVLPTTTSLTANLQVQLLINFLAGKNHWNKFIKINLFDLSFDVFSVKKSD